MAEKLDAERQQVATAMRGALWRAESFLKTVPRARQLRKLVSDALDADYQLFRREAQARVDASEKRPKGRRR